MKNSKTQTMIKSQALLAPGVVGGKNLQAEFHDQWKSKQPRGRVEVVGKVKLGKVS